MLQLFSADDHIIEHARVWSDRVPARLSGQAPHVEEHDGHEVWVYEGRRGTTMGLNAVVGRPKDQLNPDPIRFSEMRQACYDPTERAKDMLADGIFASVLFPTLPRFAGTLFLGFTDTSLASMYVAAYNDFVIDEWCPAGPPGMFVPTVIVPLWDARLAATEIRRCSKREARAVSIPENTTPLGLPSYWSEFWDPLWEACQETGSVLCLHIGTSGSIPEPSPEAPAMLSFSLLQVGSITSSVNLMMSPGWRKNMYLCMIEEPVCLRYRNGVSVGVGVDRIMWECDYPHTDTVWPDSQETTQDVFEKAGCSEEEVALISHGNAERVFGWTMATAPEPSAA